VVEGASLENWSTGNRTGGSNPSLSAITSDSSQTCGSEEPVYPLQPFLKIPLGFLPASALAEEESLWLVTSKSV
jgi:hypothetical protein